VVSLQSSFFACTNPFSFISFFCLLCIPLILLAGRPKSAQATASEAH
jgi:hypothetical protein